MSSSEPLTDRYLWAVGLKAAEFPLGELVQGRYQVVAPQIWLDTRSGLPPYCPQKLPDNIVPYLRLYPQRLHVPGVYGFALLDKEPNPERDILLLENPPVDAECKLYPSIIEAWSKASAVRQVYWLWQILQLWQPFSELGVARSLLISENLRVEGWRVHLLELGIGNWELGIGELRNRHNSLSHSKSVGGVETSSTVALIEPPEKEKQFTSLQHLGATWEKWFTEAHPSIESQLQEIYQQMQTEDVDIKEIAHNLNQLLLSSAAALNLRLRIASGTDTGPQSQHNEDTCYPHKSDLPADFSPPKDPLIPYLAIVGDGIGGHEGGEVASQLAVQSIRLQVQALMTEVAQQDEIMTPELMTEQLAAIIRVANNLIAARNDEQGRESRRRMGTTLVMALQLPQQVKTADGLDNSHELYIAHVGDSRAYWITSQYCQQLTVDDDVATREVRMGRSLHGQALQRPDGGALTQALGTRDSEFLRPTVQRFVLEEDGLLLLCSDGLSDNGLIEQSWSAYAEPVLSGQMSLESAVQYLIALANQKNGHDNTTVLLTYCRVSPEYPVLFNSIGEIGSGSLVPQVRLTPQFTEPVVASPSVAKYDEGIKPKTARQPKSIVVSSEKQQLKGWVAVLCFVLLIVTVGGAWFLAKWLVDPTGFEKMRDRLLNPDKPPAQQERSSPVPTQSE